MVVHEPRTKQNVNKLGPKKAGQLNHTIETALSKNTGAGQGTPLKGIADQAKSKSSERIENRE